ncbi:MAG TPA: addiction module protein [Verrucomicrobiae bacterium]|nr:addiction module protein [Verrucomicrobiae bacterium]
MTTTLLKKATKLPVPDRIKLVEDIWDSIADEPGEFPLTAAQKRELDRRLELMQKDPGRAIPWDEAQRRILKRRAQSK